MSIFHGYEEIDASGLRLEPGKVYDKPFKSITSLKPRRAKSLLAKGYTTVQVKELPESINPLELPLNVVSTTSQVSHDLNLNGDANFILSDEKGKLRYAIVNGFLYDLSTDKPELFHGVVL